MKPSVHYLCSGVFLQRKITLSTGAELIPLRPQGFGQQCDLVARYAASCKATVDANALRQLQDQEKDAIPVVAISVPINDWIDAPAAETRTENEFRDLRRLLAWATGNDVDLFGIVVVGPKESLFRAVPPNTIRRFRLGFGNTGDDFVQSLEAVLGHAQKDEHFAFALGMFHDALKEYEPRFKIARLFVCLESLAYKLKKGQGSRDAVRELLGIEKGRTGQVAIDDRRYNYDVILGAGILRDHLFHGVRSDFSKAKPGEKDTFDLLSAHPDVYVRDLVGRVELELARWSRGKSRGQKNGES